jgi:hypothetical protein
VQNLSGKAFFFPQQSQQQMFGTYVFVRKPFRFFGGVSQDSLAFIAQWQIDGSGDLFPDRSMTFNLLANGLDRGM